jgi:hypothetical protein
MTVATVRQTERPCHAFDSGIHVTIKKDLSTPMI